ncbi:MAG: hypothetical protein K2O12_03850 [Muribaculaceae bacterium]|nr:hypothetical protein [Muribaculaceae bacterium]
MTKIKNKNIPQPAASASWMKSWQNWLVTIGLLGVCAGAVMPLLSSFVSRAYAYVYGAGAFISLVGRIFARVPKSSQVLRRLYRIEVWSSLFFCAAAVFMYLRTAPRDWIALTMAGGMIMLYTSIRIPREIRKASRGQ